MKSGNINIDTNLSSEKQNLSMELPCTSIHADILLACHLSGDDANRSFNRVKAIEFEGKLSVEGLQWALNQLVLTNEALRSNFKVKENKQVIHSYIPFQLTCFKPSIDASISIKKFIDGEVSKYSMHVFDLEKGNLFNTELVIVSEDLNVLLFSFHQLVCDEFGFQVLLKELEQYYNSYFDANLTYNSVKPSLKQLNEHLQKEHSKNIEKDTNYFEQLFTNEYPVASMSHDFPKSVIRKIQSRKFEIKISEHLHSNLRKTAGNDNGKMEILLTSAFEVYLNCMLGVEGRFLGLHHKNREQVELQEFIGHSANILPLLMDINTEFSFNLIVQNCEAAFVKARQHQSFSIGELLKLVKVKRDKTSSAVFPIQLKYTSLRNQNRIFADMVASVKHHEPSFALFDWGIEFIEYPEELQLHWNYNSSLFHPQTIETHGIRFTEFLDYLLEHPNTALKTVAEDYKKINAQVQNKRDATAFTAIHQEIENASLGFKDVNAIHCNGETITHGELHRRSNQLANYFIQKGIQKEDRIAVFMDRSIEMMLTVYAVLKAGATYLPIDTELPLGRVNFMIENSVCKICVTEKKFTSEISNKSEVLLHSDLLAASEKCSDKNPYIKVNGNDSAYIIYTSGSTGRPKGVVVEHRNLSSLIHFASHKPGFKPGDKMIALTSLSFDVSVLELYLPYLHGGTVFLMDNVKRKDPREIFEILDQEEINFMFATPTLWKLLLKYRNSKRYPKMLAVTGGEALQQDLAAAILQMSDGLWNIYGPTETCVFSTLKEIRTEDETVTIGKPIDGTEIYILNKKLEPVIKGEEGEIYIAGEGVSRGYDNNPQFTKEKFFLDPFKKEEVQKMYRSGDIGVYLDNNEIQYVGRIDQQIKIKGYRIEIEEIEHALKKIRMINEVLVSVKEVHPEDLQLIAYVVLNKDIVNGLNVQGQVLTNSAETRAFDSIYRAWRNELSRDLPHYMIPAHFVIIESVPMNANGKIDWQILKGLNHTEKFDSSETESLNPSEQIVKEIWADVLKINSVGKHDNFFELGGHSVVAIYVMTEIEKKTGKKLPMSALFEHPTIAELAELISGTDVNYKWNSLVPIRPEGKKNPVYIIHGAGLGVMVFNNFIPFLDKNQPVYGLQAIGVHQQEIEINSIEELAAMYLKEIIESNPHGPYYLAGYSAGSVVAFEMAKQLQQSGRHVKMLALLDFSVEAIPQVRTDAKKVKMRLTRFLPSIWHSIKGLFIDPNLVISFQKQYFKLQLQGILLRLGIKIKYKPKKEDVLKKHIYQAMERFENALRNYKLNQYEGKIDVVRTPYNPEYLKDPHFLGWRKYTKQSVDVHQVPGNHDNMLLGSNGVHFAHKLQKIIDSKE